LNTSVENLAITWKSIEKVCSGLERGQWELATGCPGWSVRDQVSHLIDYESRAVGLPAPERAPADLPHLPHLKNDLGRSNEVGVDFRRSRSGTEVLEEFRQVTAKRLTQLRGLTEKDLAAEVMTPAGPGTVADMLTLRVMDSWSHEQDIRRAVGSPGHLEGPAVDEAVGYFARFVPYVVAKRAAAPEGSRVAFRIGERDPMVVEVVGGRGRLTTGSHPTVSLAIPLATFAALVGGRSDAPADAALSGDHELGQRVLESMSLMP